MTITTTNIAELEAQLASTESYAGKLRDALADAEAQAADIREAIANAQAEAPTTETEDVPESVTPTMPYVSRNELKAHLAKAVRGKAGEELAEAILTRLEWKQRNGGLARNCLRHIELRNGRNRVVNSLSYPQQERVWHALREACPDIGTNQYGRVLLGLPYDNA